MCVDVCGCVCMTMHVPPYTHTHTHTRVCVCVCVCKGGACIVIHTAFVARTPQFSPP